tara:strand:+ start:469 stop:621 length:153 start_codon:yes stop_codon:yes gene_type:complete
MNGGLFSCEFPEPVDEFDNEAVAGVCELWDVTLLNGEVLSPDTPGEAFVP